MRVRKTLRLLAGVGSGVKCQCVWLQVYPQFRHLPSEDQVLPWTEAAPPLHRKSTLLQKVCRLLHDHVHWNHFLCHTPLLPPPPGSISGVSAMLYSTLCHSILNFTLSWSTVWRWREVESLYCTLAMMPCSSPGWWVVCGQGECLPLRTPLM